MENVANVLCDMYPWKKFDFGANIGSEDWGYRYLISCILVGGSLETSTVKCANHIFELYPDVRDLAGADVTEVAKIIQSFGVRFHGPKSEHIIATAGIINNHYNGRVPDEREKLEAMPGVGRHVASVILATVYDQHEFAVDVHVRRIAKRFGAAGKTDLAIEREIVMEIPPEQLGHFSRAFVDFGQQRCAKNPNCGGCPLKEACGYESEETKTVTVDVDFSDYNIVTENGATVFTKIGSASSAIVKNGRCNCRGFRFRRTCKHINYVK